MTIAASLGLLFFVRFLRRESGRLRKTNERILPE
jgi:hypothetical protein